MWIGDFCPRRVSFLGNENPASLDRLSNDPNTLFRVIASRSDPSIFS
jgi:hypothetical protein